MDLSIIIVNYRTYKLSKETILSVFENKPLIDYEIILVDNNSNDKSIEKLEDDFKKEIVDKTLKIIKLNANKGFAYGNNKGIKIASGDYILLLNSDTIVKKDTLDSTIQYMKNHGGIGALGCKILLPNGELDKAARRNFPTPQNAFNKFFGFLNLSKIKKKNNKNKKENKKDNEKNDKSKKDNENKKNNNKKINNYNIADLDENEIYEVDSIVGAFMLVNRKTINKIGLLDEDFFMYGEDIDWCYRIKEGGWKVIYYGKSEIIHYKGGSSKKQSNKLIYHFYKSMYIFYKKHYSNSYSFITKISVYLGILILLIIKLFLNIFKKKTS
ncbi:glycosyltransferase family 2 protein [Methanobrevibacter curvatus]|uniref:N-acetylglucosaminyl-diphospho-decaprenol L-rhamnosyltransferase n=1 Tax=Methanobrevibacter curvatus TaxID=49547 RepID=A0A166CNE3_9EURY|nr:glycosyltransferase family 2 protein [Methanobrevibacter curvatus]KZX15597.1 N-acetylglucosaminyl-diphospho-decaprenol L-rhamnosyltransferase [Methanobrevibacter curvatus]